MAHAIDSVEIDFTLALPYKRDLVLDGLARFKPSWDAFEELQKRILSLKSLPLDVRQLSASCPQLRSASIDLCGDMTARSLTQPMDVVIQFEGSTRWPDDIAAVQRIKIAFLAKLSELLESQTASYICHLGLENEDKPLLNPAYLDIMTNALTFRFRVYHDREVALLSRQAREKVTTGQSREAADFAIALHKRIFVLSPAYTHFFRILCSKFTLLSPTIRLLKQWCSSHLLSPHFSPEVLELIAARAFTSPFPYDIPGSLRSAFFRSLSFIAGWNWSIEPLILDLRGDMTDLEVETIRKCFEGWRSNDPAMNRVVLFVASNFDLEGTAWTFQGPIKVVAARLTSLARAACSLFETHNFALDARKLFTSNLMEYDFIIHLKPNQLNQSQDGRSNATSKDVQSFSGQDKMLIWLTRFEHFTDELKRTFGDSIVFFHDNGTQPLIASLWNPRTDKGPWKSNTTYSARVVSDGVKEPCFSINKTAILSDIARLGGNMICKIETRDKV